MGDLAKDINSKFENNRVKALLNIIYTANWITSCQNEFFKDFGISPQQYNILRILKGAGEALNVQTIKLLYDTFQTFKYSNFSIIPFKGSNFSISHFPSFHTVQTFQSSQTFEVFKLSNFRSVKPLYVTPTRGGRRA